MNYVHFRCAVTTIALIAIASAHSQTYDVKHTYDLHLNSKPGQVYRGNWAWNDHAVAESISEGTKKKDNINKYNFNPARSDLQNASVTSGSASASASAQLQANLDGTGFHEVFGFATAFAPDGIRATANSRSRLALNIGTKDARGRIRWSPHWKIDSIAGGTVKDPVDMTSTNLDTNVVTSTELFSTDLSFADIGSASYDAGRLQLSGATGHLDIHMDSPYITSGRGNLSMTFVKGIVTSSSDDGIFDGILPGVGAPATLDHMFGDANGDFNIDFDMGSPNTNGYDMTADFDAGGEVQAGADAVPEPMTLLALGMGVAGIVRRRSRN